MTCERKGEKEREKRTMKNHSVFRFQCESWNFIKWFMIFPWKYILNTEKLHWWTKQQYMTSHLFLKVFFFYASSISTPSHSFILFFFSCLYTSFYSFSFRGHHCCCYRVAYGKTVKVYYAISVGVNCYAQCWIWSETSKLCKNSMRKLFFFFASKERKSEKRKNQITIAKLTCKRWRYT